MAEVAPGMPCRAPLMQLIKRKARLHYEIVVEQAGYDLRRC
jgi:hypothetical protein